MAGPYQEGNHKATKNKCIMHYCTLLDSKHNIDLVVLHVLLRSLKKCFKFVFKIRDYGLCSIFHTGYYIILNIYQSYICQSERDRKKYDCLNEINLQIFVIFYRVVFVLLYVIRTGLFESFNSLTYMYHQCVDIQVFPSLK